MNCFFVDTRESAPERNPISPTPPPPGTGDRAFQIYQGIGIYAGNDTQRDLGILTWAFGVSPQGDTKWPALRLER